MAKQFIFNDQLYYNLNELGIAFSNDFKSAINCVLNNTKSLIKFIKKHNKKLAIEIANIIISCKYINNVITFIIFNLCDDKRVVINGLNLNFKEFVSSLKDKDNVALISFIKDLGITNTYAKLKIDSRLEVDSYFIEKNIDDPFVYKYLTTYYEFDIVESLESFINMLFIYNEENFRKASKVVRNERFQLVLAHRVGFKDVFLMRQQPNPLFYACKLLAKEEFKHDDLLMLTNDTFYWWLLDRYVLYKFKGKANDIRKKLDNQKRIYIKGYNKLSFEGKIDYANELYDIYLEFIKLYQEELITIDKKSDIEPFVLDKAYCKTFICFDYMNTHIVKLPRDYTEEEKKEEIENPEPENIAFKDEDLIDNPKYAPNKIKKQEKLTYKLRRFASFSTFFSILFMIITLATFGLSYVAINDKYLAPEMQISIIELIGACASAILVFILGCVLKIRTNSTLKNLNKVKLLKNIKNQNALTQKQELTYNSLKETEHKFSKKAIRGHRILSTLILTFQAIAFSIGAICLCVLLVYHLNFPMDFDKFAGINTQEFRYMVIGIAAIAALIYGVIRKRKGAFTTLLILLISIALPVVFMLVG